MCNLRPQILRHIVLLSLYLLTCSARTSYYITAPQYVIPGVNTTLAVHVFGEQYSDINVTAGIAAGFNVLVQAYKIISNVELQDILDDYFYKIKLAGIPANSSTSDNYLLLVNGCVKSTLVFTEQKQIGILTKKMSMFIQTDKDVYSPGETVHIRVISVSRDLKPYNGDVDLEMKSNVFSTSFFVKDYGLPKFIVTLDAPQFYVVSKMLNLTGTVTAKYYSSKPLKGNVTVTVKPSYGQDVSEVKETYQISGSLSFSFPYTEIEKAVYLQGINLTASVTDQVSGIVVETSSFIWVTNFEYEINFIDQNPAFMPGGNFTAKVQIQRIDKNLLTEQERQKLVTVNITSDTETVQKLYVIPENGIITVQFPVYLSVRGINVIYITAQYQNTNSSYTTTDVFSYNPLVRLQTPDSTLKVGIPFEVQVDVQVKVQHIYYTVVSKGLVVVAGKNRTTFSLTPENSWAPTAELLVYLISFGKDNNKIMQISKTLNIKGTLNQKMGLSWSKGTAKPLEQVSLIANVEDSLSLVGLCIADKSSTIIKRQNDLTSRVYQELNSYNMGAPFGLTNADVYRPRPSFSAPRVARRTEMTPRQDESVFPIIWIWLETNISSSLQSIFPLTVPDVNTTWVATAFVISENLGLGVAEEPAEISVLKPFVVSLNMPYSVIRGEQFILEVTLKNDLIEDLQVLVTLENDITFNIIAPYNNNSSPTVAGQHKVIVPREEVTTVLFPIEPKELGNITFTVKAESKTATDVLTQSILVKAEGMKFFYTQTELFDLSASENITQTVSKSFSFSLPGDVVQGSEEAFVTVVGDPLVPAINGLESLIQLPYGCGEQNMIHFAPNIYILQYLIASKKITEDIRARSVDFMHTGYQKELTYKRSDGSFSAFGNADSSGSTWLSAFVFRCFLQAKKFMYISPSVLDDIALWFVQYQNMTTGVFIEPGEVIDKKLQGGVDSPVTLTAYILISLLEDNKYRQLYDMNIQKAVQYIENKFDEGIPTTYTLSVVAYALTLANSTKAEAALTKLNSMAITSGELKFWSSSPSATTNYYWKPRTTDIESTAYALLSFIEQRRFSDALPVLKWLTQQMSSLGGFESTQDTIVALQALCKALELFSPKDTSLTVSISGSTVKIPKRFYITNDNLLLLHRQQIKASRSLSVNATAVGRGVAIVQFNVLYNRKTLSRRRRNTPVTEAFTLDVNVEENTNSINVLSVDICTSYKGMGNESGMALLDVGFLSGFTLKTEDFTRPTSLKLVEPKKDRVYLYFDSLTNDKLCLSIPMVRFAMVAGSEDAVIKVYDYYSPEMTATRTYNSLTMSQISSCDYCGSNCNLCRSNVPVIMKPLTSNAYRPAMSILWLYVILLCQVL
ncbi:CD109 antigen-like [Rana temporaria]|uniref:CD109 antigen-like n=1 Tax=Rana temporaria TaxID=8407 RepID=UPI001AACCAF7|nr:CD109 antigen-like [Rana temporaria]